jgi:hypothetical protein
MLRVERWVNQQTCIVAEGETQLDVFSQLASMQEVFGDTTCGKCKGSDLRFQVRKAKKGKKDLAYPEMVCKNPKCKAKLSYGQSDGGVLFPIRFEREKNDEDVTVYVKDENGRMIPRGSYGWVVYNPETGKEE